MVSCQKDTTNRNDMLAIPPIPPHKDEQLYLAEIPISTTDCACA